MNDDNAKRYEGQTFRWEFISLNVLVVVIAIN